MFEALHVGQAGECTLVVAKEHTAAHWGSGALEVLATPQMVALMEMAAVAAVDSRLPAGYRTVGIHLDISHLAATPLGGTVQAHAELIAVDGRKLVFRVEAHDQVGKIGEGTHQRFIIEEARFMQKAAARGQ
jgi:fluoroacetyl-CoA thioesterase